jgi:hypothetical protein
MIDGRFSFADGLRNEKSTGVGDAMITATPEYRQRIIDIDEQGDGLSKREINYIASLIDKPDTITLSEFGQLIVDLIYHLRVDRKAGVLDE